ncbi:MAG: hypothetical protein CML66_14440 [Rhodobacteraceae bacterium]|nr:hypothetical protein [Paracoccaceae bacterium]
MADDPLDPKGLIRESYRIEGITPGECRSIFLDWALGLPIETDTETARQALLTRFQVSRPDHPMTDVLREGLGDAARPRRRGGWRSRDRGTNG